MSKRSIVLTEPLYDYLIANGVREPEVMRRLREETASVSGSGMQIGAEQGQFMSLLVELIGARRCLEIGTFTGYSALAVARAMPSDGRLICCDVSEEWTAIGRRYWQEAGVADRIDLRLGPALETLDALIGDGESGKFDFAFIDADKENYDGYYERCLTLVRPGGLIAIDNVLWSGSVINPDRQTEETKAIRAINAKIHGDERVTVSMLPIGDGLTLARVR